MRVKTMNRRREALGEAHMSAVSANVMTTPNASMRFWIITMMLVLVGLASQKIR
jgi:UDP-N-acetylmuramyl pentapeptide phosphotransferase/UDP-N-acetylglucosamine-1-phosphate transferase